jgi:hypothetical protein
MQNNITNALLSLLNKGIVRFTYRKVDGTIRKAIGTRNLAEARLHFGLIVPAPKTGHNNPTAYYDIEKEAWRSFVAENVLSINGIDINEIKGVKGNNIVRVDEPIEVEIPINFGGFCGGLPIGGGIPKEEICKAMNKLDKDIVIGAPAHSPKIGTPTATDKGIALPLGDVSVDDFAKMVAHYVVEELIGRIK